MARPDPLLMRLRVMGPPAVWVDSRPAGMDARRVQGGWLLQDWDVGADFGWSVASKGTPDDDTAAALRFAWQVCRSVKSNAIVLARAIDAAAERGLPIPPKRLVHDAAHKAAEQTDP